ncbi:Protein-L-isoaspartate O-methyltransferase [hydrothermal vent metagenome]|uniref:Protein-L-isoaspartate O-methyltransferase n=1 Tax=hydrothermal vent metagenome TaxID=652676 RepID=A0A3B0SLT5_9ZZZZ
MGHENFSEMRKAMVVSQLRTTEVEDRRVIAAMSDVAREDFVPAAQRQVAYSDRGVQIGEGRALNSPLATGRLLDAAELKADDNVLLIGGATGYTAALLSRLVKSVVSIEQSGKLVTRAKKALDGTSNVRIEKVARHADGFAEDAPYSVIIIDGVVEQIPQTLVDQLHDDGRLVAAILDSGITRLAIGRKAGGVIGYQYFADCGGAVLPGFDKAKSFSF